MVRGRLFAGESTLELIAVPFFRASTFDALDADSSPFTFVASPGLPVVRRNPARRFENVQGGGRFTSTAGRFDWGTTVYRGLRTFPTLTLVTDASGARIDETFPRFTMIGGDFETVRGPWGVRGEAAAFVEDTLQSAASARGVPGRAVEAGAGVDRRAGDYRVGGNLVWARRLVDDSRATALEKQELERWDINVVLAAERSFARDTRSARLLGVYDPREDTVFVRAIATVSLRDDVVVEGSAAVFAGEAPSVLGRLTHRDLFYGRLKVFF
jgi:hypothetical protein